MEERKEYALLPASACLSVDLDRLVDRVHVLFREPYRMYVLIGPILRRRSKPVRLGVRVHVRPALRPVPECVQKSDMARRVNSRLFRADRAQSRMRPLCLYVWNKLSINQRRPSVRPAASALHAWLMAASPSSPAGRRIYGCIRMHAPRASPGGYTNTRLADRCDLDMCTYGI